MLRSIMSEVDVIKGLRSIQEKILISCEKRPAEFKKVQPRLVAVSKTKPNELIIAAYSAGQRHFGENYVQELVDKSNDSEIRELCPEICWHFIGNLQRNKVSKLLTSPCLYMVETVGTDKLATTLNAAWLKRAAPNDKLKVMVQVNTSGEKEKNGCEPEEAISLVKHVKHNCPGLDLVGLMTIGEFGYNLDLGPNPDFLCLRKVSDEVCSALGLDFLELSMGMSNDFEHAIEMGSTNVRVGSSIFGYREPKGLAEAGVTNN